MTSMAPVSPLRSSSYTPWNPTTRPSHFLKLKYSSLFTDDAHVGSHSGHDIHTMGGGGLCGAAWHYRGSASSREADRVVVMAL